MTEIIKFGAEWCGPCKVIDKLLDDPEIKSCHKNVTKIDIDEHPELAKLYRIKRLPTLIIKENDSEIKRFEGVCTKSQILNF